MSETSSKSESTTEEIKALRLELNSVTWVQCDSCLKWRKVKREDAENMNDATPWQCSMNKDSHFNKCNIAQEDTRQFDLLAKKAKLSVIKSELKPGSLVLAKTSGYCSWPALITKDPANEEYCDGDDMEIIWYHVEYIGGKRTHGWVRSAHVEVFGSGEFPDTPHIDMKKASFSHPQKNKMKRKKKLTNTKIYRRERTRYIGGQTLAEAQQEALKLLPLSCNARLKTCVFTFRNVQRDPKLRPISKKSASKTKPYKIKRGRPVTTKKYHNSVVSPLPSTKKPKVFVTPDKSNGKDVMSQSHQTPASIFIDNYSSDVESNELVVAEKLDIDLKAEKPFFQPNLKSRLEPFFDFSTSLIDVSKEERLLADAERYRSNSLTFKTNLAAFFSLHGLPECKTPVWSQINIDLFELFLTVLERGGFLAVTEDHQWSNIHQELTHQLFKDGGSKTKAFYKKNLYPYELYMQGRDYTNVMEELLNKKSLTIRNRMDPSLNGNENDCSKDVIENDLMKELEELDEYLQSAIEEAVKGNRDADSNKENTCLDSSCSSNILALEDCHWQLAGDPETAQASLDSTVPDYSPIRPSKSFSYDIREQGKLNLDNSQEWTLHELQSLEHTFHPSPQ